MGMPDKWTRFHARYISPPRLRAARRLETRVTIFGVYRQSRRREVPSS
jgi:hypothetical protein